MTYKETLAWAMTGMAGTDPRVRFVGYGLLNGRAAGTLKNVRREQIIETPVAENLMVSLAIGLSLRGLRPVVYFERMDFILNALDAIVNHLDKLEWISRVEFRPAVILRVVVGNSQKPLYTGATHTQDFSRQLGDLVAFPVKTLTAAPLIQPAYRDAHARMEIGQSTMLVEYKDLL
jgi:pyruvate/2-oxoglutarate/acetoin dehydrogenase E1 component